ncbi:hypothetical protein BDP81DRAFT_417760 [Colletotrichum phormii]|uniref:Uncharacterized protein n=1 Tax=Colletotrichum phormii TaxID=359342 RepID=A0AAJ0ELJ0_9PEZI|nr:uncharacterized protein BDP81DRAFT_417760 [Colletotrichum phormii]KAK1640960.1 hypothetical protein BDP81DRAFT_417760 [Colletotrichum phormii]
MEMGWLLCLYVLIMFQPLYVYSYFTARIQHPLPYGCHVYVSRPSTPYTDTNISSVSRTSLPCHAVRVRSGPARSHGQ